MTYYAANGQLFDRPKCPKHLIKTKWTGHPPPLEQQAAQFGKVIKKSEMIQLDALPFKLPNDIHTHSRETVMGLLYQLADQGSTIPATQKMAEMLGPDWNLAEVSAFLNHLRRARRLNYVLSKCNKHRSLRLPNGRELRTVGCPDELRVEPW